MKNYDITKTKLIIWDLDDTFWKGTLSEGGVEFLPEMISFIEETDAQRYYELHLLKKRF